MALSDLCDESGCHLAMVYRWQRALFENATMALQGGRDLERGGDQKRIRELEAKLAAKKEVLSELMEEHIHPGSGNGSCPNVTLLSPEQTLCG
ncbi:MAG: transposase [Magnetococcales bacterium]|nr:transposase [Magnetococcales bacterium]